MEELFFSEVMKLNSFKGTILFLKFVNSI